MSYISPFSVPFRCVFLRWDRCSAEVGQHRSWTNKLEAREQPGLGPEVYTGAGPGRTHTHLLLFKEHLRCWLSLVFMPQSRCPTSVCCCPSHLYDSPVSWRSRCTGVTGVRSVLSSSCGWKTSWTTNVTGCVCTWNHRGCCLLRCTHTHSHTPSS